MNGLMLILGILLIFLSVFLLMEYAYGQNTSLNNYGAQTTDTNKQDITELNICAEYKEGCDIVPQNTKIPFSMIPQQDNKDVKQNYQSNSVSTEQKRIYA